MTYALTAVAVVAAAALAGACGEADTREPSSSPADAAAKFAPRLQLARDEEFVPMSTAHFLRHSGLEWGGDGCYSWDVTASGYEWPEFDGWLRQLDPSRLGPDRPYRARAYRDAPGCEERRGRVYTSDQQTRPFSRAHRPRGLPVGEGFNLDMAEEPGRRREGPDADGVLRSVSAYYTRTRETVDGADGWRFAYWVLFQRSLTPEGGAVREGDWERIDVLVRPGKRAGDYRPVAVDLHVDGRVRRTPWSAVERVGDDDATHPIVRLEVKTHTPALSSGCADCARWDTWEDLRDARREPWWGYGGGWGEIGGSDHSSGAAGPSPYTLDAPAPERSPARAEPASARSPRRFAPEVQFSPDETLLPFGTARFLLHSGLEWAGGGCQDRNITESGWGWPEFSDPQDQLDPARLGPDDPYRARSYEGACLDPRGPEYRSDQQTRPFGAHGRPPGLRLDEGFNLDLASTTHGGGPTTAGDLGEIPAYYTSAIETVGGRPGLRLSYWMLFPVGRIPGTSEYREGDWERVDVILGRPGGPGGFQPMSLEIHADGRRRSVPWRTAMRAGRGSTHPVVRLARETHTPELAPKCATCPTWRVWNRLREAEREPWWGYGGGWGEIGDSDASSGSAGPSPYAR